MIDNFRNRNVVENKKRTTAHDLSLETINFASGQKLPCLVVMETFLKLYDKIVTTI